ncbi:PA3715 family protein [Pandoraea sputorum]|uniref:Multidrug ABC transporter ATPase n=1 Tax=Pandoraea sputorum TaxID=93222 RepID=A0A5E5BHG2_9BURK|nr:hypothetical protein [Pandoraea sputorum]VVE84465.1 hypothetical protein PSP31121_04776 [Pandoraea sputorum]
MRTVLAAPLLCLPLLAHAGCQDRLNDWTKRLQPGRTLATELSSCKVWPANPSQTLAVLPLPQKGGSDEHTVYDVDIVVADSQSGKVIAHRFEKAAFTSDAIGLRSVVLDTASWQLTRDVLAFGVRATREGTSRVAPFAQTTLSLYVVDGPTLSQRLDTLVTQTSSGQWDGNCAGRFTDTSRAIALGPAGPSGYASLIVSEKVVTTTNTPTRSDCASTQRTAKHPSVTLDYDGTHYPIPAALSRR